MEYYNATMIFQNHGRARDTLIAVEVA
ncbi:uncharacterized protein G2W53_030484 [Senna tora]|uniref:Uncharacterized protein n=1 Tax=Senna tora TaxID=362788 RepID=A0A834WAU3_9FABA|nr:uncharacterized protein G2W53_030484 [Senna tora]